MERTLLRLVDDVGGRQHGLITWRQSRRLGVDQSRLERWLAEGRVVRVQPLVYRLVGTPSTWEQRQLAPVLAAGSGAAASHLAAAWLWGLVEDAPLRPELSVPHGRLPRLVGTTVHRSRDLAPRWTTRRRGIPVTNPLLTLVDLGAVLPPWEVEDALDRGLVARRFSVAAVEWARNEVGRPGRRGAGVLGRVLDERALGRDRPDGLLEPRMARLLQAAALPPAVFQYPVPGTRFRVDFAYPDRMLALEVDGHETHSTPRALQDDLDRQNALVALGWTVLRFTWADVVRRPSKVAAAIRGALGTRTAA